MEYIGLALVGLGIVLSISFGYWGITFKLEEIAEAIRRLKDGSR